VLHEHRLELRIIKFNIYHHFIICRWAYCLQLQSSYC